MPHKVVEIDDFDCNLLFCNENYEGCCDADTDVDSLKANSKKCEYYHFVGNKAYITAAEYEIDELVDLCEECGFAYKVIEEESNRLVLKTMNNKSGLFRVSLEGEKEYHFFSCVDGGVNFVHNSVKEADLFVGGNDEKCD